jgi:hypothetical protein
VFGLKAAVKIYKRLLLLYPPSFRCEFGPELVQTFDAMMREAKTRRGTYGVVCLLVYVLIDLVVTALKLRMKERGKRMNRTSLIVGWMLLLPAMLFVFANVVGLNDWLQPIMENPSTRTWFNLVSPVVFFGGPLVGMLINLFSVFRLDKESDTFILQIGIRKKASHVIVSAVNALVLVVLAAYVVVENILS